MFNGRQTEGFLSELSAFGASKIQTHEIALTGKSKCHSVNRDGDIFGEAVDEFEDFRERCPILEKEFGNTGEGKEMLQSPAGPAAFWFCANESMFFTVLQFAGAPVARKEGARGASRRTSAFTFAGIRNSRQ